MVRLEYKWKKNSPTTGEALFTALVEILLTFDLKLEDIIGYASDGASNVSGENNSVWSRVRNASPGCVQMKCICHSLALVMEHSFEKIPSTIAFLISEIPGHFSNSTLRRDEFKELSSVMNPDGCISPSPFIKFSRTRWLARGKVLYNILVNWFELQAYFEAISRKAPANQRYKIRQIHSILEEKSNSFYKWVHYLTVKYIFLQKTKDQSSKLMFEILYKKNSIRAYIIIWSSRGNVYIY